jgi:hypothetical protein
MERFQRNTTRHIRHAPAGKFNIVREPMDIFMVRLLAPAQQENLAHASQLSLFAADFVQALGAVMDIKWIKDGKVEIGTFCTAQGKSLHAKQPQLGSSNCPGVIQQLGETGVAMTTLVRFSIPRITEETLMTVYS